MGRERVVLQIFANTGNWVPVIELALEGTAGVEEAAVDIDEAVVVCDTAVVSPDILATVVRDVGKLAKVVSREPA